MNRRLLSLAPLLWMLALACDAQPREAVQLVNPYPATGPHEVSGTIPANKVLRTMQDHAVPPVTDVVARALQGTLSLALDAAVSLKRLPRRNGEEALVRVATSTTDARTLLLGGSDLMVIRALLADERYASRRELVPVALLAVMPTVLLTNRKSTLDELVSSSRSVAGTLHVASSGELTTAHFAALLFRRAAGGRLSPVAFNGAHAGARAVVAGEVEAAFLPLPAALAYARSARLRAIAITDTERHPLLAEVPTMAEAGMPEMVFNSWFGLFAPGVMAPRLNQRTTASIAAEWLEPQSAQHLSQHGLRALYLPSALFRQRIQADSERWQPYIDALKPR